MSKLGMRSSVAGYVAAVTAVGVATLLRLALDPAFKDDVPYITYFAAVIFAAWYAGLQPAVLAIGLSYFAADYFFIRPRHGLTLLTLDPKNLISACVFVAVCSAIAGFGEALRRARLKADLAAHRTNSILASVSDGFISLDRDWRVTFLNPAAEKLIGMTATDVLGKSHWEVFPATLGTIVETKYKEAMANGTPVTFENFYEPWQRWFDIKASPAPDGIVVDFRDITERKVHDDQLRAQREWLRVTLESIGDAVVATDREGHVSFMNSLAEHLTGWTGSEASGKPLHDIFHIVNERTRKPAENPCDRALETGRVVGLANHTVLIARDGAERPIDDSAAPIKAADGRVIGVVLVFRDATEERRARDTMERLAAIVEHSNDAIIGKTLDGTVTNWNAAAADLYGFTAEEAVGQPMSIIVPPERKTELAEIMSRLRKGEPVEHLETVRMRKDGSRVDVSLTISPIKDSYGEVVGASKLARDITAVKKAREALERSERQLNDFFENSAVGLHWVGPDGMILRVNQAELDLLGYSRDEYLSHHIAEFHVDKNAIDDILACLTRLETIQSYEARLRCKDGSIKHVLIDSNVYTENGEFIHTRCFTRDITDRKKAENNLQFLVDASDSVASLVDVRSSMQKLARRSVPAFADWCAVHLISETGGIQKLAHAHADAGKDAVLSEFFDRHPIDWNRLSPHIRVLHSGRAELAEEVTPTQFAVVIEDDGHRQLLEKLNARSFIVVPLESRGRVTGTIEFVRTESNRRFTSDDLELAEDLAKRAATAIDNCRLYDELRLADRQKDDFLAMLAHELRNPLAAISYAGQLLNLSPEHGASATAIVSRQVQQLSNLINDLLDMSRITRGMIQLKKEGIDTEVLVNRALETAQPALEQQRHTVVREISPGKMPLFVDPTRVEQILVNLLTNAAKYTPQGGQVTVTAFPDNDQVIIRVRDTGIGIPPLMLPRVFDMFTQVNPSIDRAQGGLGIGLTVVRRLVEMHEGTVSASSEGLGKGSAFTLRLPMGRALSHGDATQPHGAGVRHGLRVLVVDDNVDTATSVSMLLQTARCITETVYDGPSAPDRSRLMRWS